jgi:glycosyltransferase involved in cell wall biosynthesis
MGRMRVVMVSKALVVGAYQRKAEEIAQRGVDLTVLIPPRWDDRRGRQEATLRHTQGYNLRTIPLRFNGNFHIHYYPTLAQELRKLQPQLLHFDEEPYNLATWLGLQAASRLSITSTFFTWQNLQRTYPPPFRWFEQSNYRHTPLAIAGNQAAAEVLRQKGYRGEIAIIPQFGVDPNQFKPLLAPNPSPVRIGYAGGLLPEKGIDLLLQACAQLTGEWQLRLAGAGQAEPALRQLASTLGIAHRIDWVGRLSSEEMPDFYQTLDLFVLPSRTTRTWKEQFGRVLVEAMACGVPVIGSDSGEIPHVVGEAGLIFAEEDVAALQAHLQRLIDYPDERQRLGKLGRERVLAHFTMASVAERTVAVYERLLALGSTRAGQSARGNG